MSVSAVWGLVAQHRSGVPDARWGRAPTANEAVNSDAYGAATVTCASCSRMLEERHGCWLMMGGDPPSERSPSCRLTFRCWHLGPTCTRALLLRPCAHPRPVGVEYCFTTRLGRGQRGSIVTGLSRFCYVRGPQAEARGAIIQAPVFARDDALSNSPSPAGAPGGNGRRPAGAWRSDQHP
jgi:hypothetical protein